MEYNITAVITVDEDHVLEMEKKVNAFLTSLNNDPMVLNVDIATDKNKD